MPNEIARKLRKQMTPHEAKLWVQLRLLPKGEFHFRRQVPVGPYIVDFAEKTHSLVIELDGSQHAETLAVEKDAQRGRYLSNKGFKVLRFWNFEVDQNMSGVIDTILLHCQGKKN
ncbi:MAG: DUF559 domain-containing protein [Aestuariivirga sp.]